MNPTTNAFEERVAKLEGGAMAVATSSGMAAQLAAILNICQSGDNFITASNLYGGTYNQFKCTFPQLGIQVKFTQGNGQDLAGIEAQIDENTKCIYVETIGNPSYNVPDFEGLSALSDKYEIPIICDNTFGMCGYVCRPIAFGAHVVCASATKWIGGHGTTVGGVITDSAKFMWNAPVRSVFGDPSSAPKTDADGKPIAKFPLINGPCPAYHDMDMWQVFGPDGPFGANIAFAIRLRVVNLRDMGMCQNPFGSFLLVQGLETLSLRGKAHCENANAMAQWLKAHDGVTWVSHPSLDDHECHAAAEKYFRPGTYGSVLSFGVKAGAQASVLEAAKVFTNNLKIVSNLANVGDAKTLIIHPASTTHEQLSEEEMVTAGVTQDMLRLSVGFEDIEDLKADFEAGFAAVNTSQ
jgi:O-acetylhomoserine/O-acetylserine sulfhydrylase-like pyridoxal-dependent enzyme